MMKKRFGIITAATAIVLATFATSAYLTKSAGGTAASPATVIFPAEALKNIRVVRISYDTDTNNAYLYYRYGTGAYVLTQTNANTGTNIVINTTNGIAASSFVMLQKSDGTTATATVHTVAGGSSTNLWLASGGFGVAGAIGDQLFLMSTATTEPATADSAINGEAIYVSGQQSRPLWIQLAPANVTNRLNSVTAIYE